MLALYLVLSWCGGLAYARKALTIATLILLASTLVDVIQPNTFSTEPNRAAGLHLNPNQGGAALVMGMILTRDAIPDKYRIGYQLLIGLAVLSTFSRSAILCWTVVFALSFLGNVTRPSPSRLPKLLLSAAIVAGLFLAGDTLVGKLQSLTFASNDLENRIQFFTSGSIEDTSAQGRFEIANEAWDKFQQRPILGYGTGGSKLDPPFDELFIHNMYLAMAIEHGFFGIALYLALVVSLVIQTRDFGGSPPVLIAVFLLFWAFFSHTIFDQRHYAVTFVLASLMASSSAAAGNVRAATGSTSERLAFT
jgi:O-antigen ligase